jgi:phosphatidylethanolamine/phosphatidyl-N-methylethanolamine N-methyltransferase
MPAKGSTKAKEQRRAEHHRVIDDQVRFLKSWIENPLKTGAVAPSGKHLARAMAQVIDPADPGPVIELGPGTGVVTEAIVERGVDPSRIVAIEFNPDFAKLLRQRFPTATILDGDAYAVASLFGALGGEPAVATISSLPLFTEPPGKRVAMVMDCFHSMRPGSPFIQFSYALVSPVPKMIHGMRVDTSDWILKNVPPARVWTYRRP